VTGGSKIGGQSCIKDKGLGMSDKGLAECG